MPRARRRGQTSLWLDALNAGFDAQAVVGLRVMHAAMGRGSERENALMVSEKLDVLAKAQHAGFLALATGGPVVAAEHFFRVYRRAVRANRRRLGG